MPGPAKPVITYADISAVTIKALNRLMDDGDKKYHKLMSSQFDPEIIPGYIEAWRWWDTKAVMVPRSDGIKAVIVPYSTGDGQYHWHWDGENIADELPTLANSNGFYAYKKEFIEDHQMPLFGRVALYGTVVECEYGYRAEKARILDVWVDQEALSLTLPSARNELVHHPQVKGTFDTFDPCICDIYGMMEDYQCLTLESHKELSGSSLSDGQMTNQYTLLIDDRKRLRNRSQPRSNRSMWDWGYTTVEALFKLGLTVIQPAYQKEWVVKPKGRYCDLCGERIVDGQMVSIDHTLPNGNLTTLVLSNKFEMKPVWYHISCVNKLSVPSWATCKMSFDPATGITGTVMWVNNAPYAAVI